MATETIILSAHAVERFRERVRPALSIEAAEEELAHLVLAGEMVTRAPRWHTDRAAQEAPRYLLIADLILPLQPARDEGHHVATTCLVKGSPSDASRARRNRRRVGRNSGRAFPAIAHGVRGARR
jgi:hypothetical protein